MSNTFQLCGCIRLASGSALAVCAQFFRWVVVEASVCHLLERGSTLASSQRRHAAAGSAPRSLRLFLSPPSGLRSRSDRRELAAEAFRRLQLSTGQLKRGTGRRFVSAVPAHVVPVTAESVVSSSHRYEKRGIEPLFPYRDPLDRFLELS